MIALERPHGIPKHKARQLETRASSRYTQPMFATVVFFLAFLLFFPGISLIVLSRTALKKSRARFFTAIVGSVLVLPLALLLALIAVNLSIQSIQNIQEKGPLFLAIERGDLVEVKRLCPSRFKPNQPNQTNGQFPLLFAIDKGKEKIVAYLLDEGASVAVKNIWDMDALCIAAMGKDKEKAIRVCRLLMEAGASPNAQAPGTDSALIYAAEAKNPELVSLLLERGANPKHRGIDFKTALHAASSARSIDSVSALLQAGANADAKNAEGLSPIYLAASFFDSAYDKPTRADARAIFHILLPLTKDLTLRDGQGQALEDLCGSPEFSAELAAFRRFAALKRRRQN